MNIIMYSKHKIYSNNENNITKLYLRFILIYFLKHNKLKIKINYFRYNIIINFFI